MTKKSRKPRHPALIVHGGASEIPEEMYEESLDGCRDGARIGWKILTTGGSALDAVEGAVCVLEDDWTFDAGRGSVLNAAGEIELDAVIMDGSNLNLGAVMAVKHVSNPVTLARLVMAESDHAILVSEGAEEFARDHGLCPHPNWELIVDRERERWRSHRSGEDQSNETLRGYPGGTVGAVALDVDGHLAVATSTGGTFYKHPGRVGDSPLVGCGAYADDRSGAVSATGDGEDLMKVVISKSVCDLMYSGMSAEEAAEAGITLLARRTGGRGGLIVLGRDGDIGLAHNTSHLAYATVAQGEMVFGVRV